MSVKIGHASIDERGKISCGKAGDQTKKEVCTRTWYAKNWDCVLRPKSAQVAEKSAVAMEQACANANVGYDQSGRNTLWKEALKVNFNLSKITVVCECDCSSLIHVCVLAAGVNIAYGSNGFTTRTMASKLVASGQYEKLTASKYTDSDKYLKRGDIIVREGSHTVMVLENGSGVTSASTTSKADELEVDGEWGILTTKLSQKVLGTKQDGIISKQKYTLKKYVPNALTTSWEFKTSDYNGGSLLIKAIQNLVGLTGKAVDGQCGKDTVKAMQRFLNAKGFNCGTVDGEMGEKTVKAWQRYINSRL